MAVPESHWRNVGRVAVHAAWLEETGALIVHASRGGWDMTYDHLEFARSKRGLLEELRKIADRLVDAESRRWDPVTGDVIVERGALATSLREFTSRADALLVRRDRIVHSVPWRNWLSADMQVIHPRSIRDDPSAASSPLPADDVCNRLVQELEEHAAVGRRLAPRIAAALNPPGT